MYVQLPSFGDLEKLSLYRGFGKPLWVALWSPTCIKALWSTLISVGKKTEICVSMYEASRDFPKPPLHRIFIKLPLHKDFVKSSSIAPRCSVKSHLYKGILKHPQICMKKGLNVWMYVCMRSFLYGGFAKPLLYGGFIMLLPKTSQSPYVLCLTPSIKGMCEAPSLDVDHEDPRGFAKPLFFRVSWSP